MHHHGASSVCQTVGWCTIKAHFPSCGTRIHHSLWPPAAAHLCCDSHPFQHRGVHIPRPAAPAPVLQCCPDSFRHQFSPDSWQESLQLSPKFSLFAQFTLGVNKQVNDFSSGIFLMFFNTSSAFMKTYWCMMHRCWFIYEAISCNRSLRYATNIKIGYIFTTPLRDCLWFFWNLDMTVNVWRAVHRVGTFVRI